jgi:hypothetical protein
MGTVHAIRTADTRGIRREHRSDRFQARPSIDDRSRAGFIRRGSVGEMASDGIGGRRVLDWHGRGLVPCVVCDRGSTVTLLSGPGLRWVLRRAESSEFGGRIPCPEPPARDSFAGPLSSTRGRAALGA